MKAKGLRRYFTGKPCSKGHIAERHYTGTCVECGKAARLAWNKRNPGVGTEVSRQWRLRNPERYREAVLRSKRKAMGIPEATRPMPLNCECCDVSFSVRQPHLDPDHTTGAFRGWLCNRCNRGLGYFDDNAAGLRRALDYIERNS